MSDRPDTTDDIIREMRDLGALDAQCNDMIPRSLQALGLRTYAARLEAAAQRQREAAEARQLNECVVVREEEAANWRKRMGDAAAMRAALEAMLEECCSLCDVPNQSKAIDKARAALAAPPRNCDVGTAEEQAKRFATLCNKYYDDENPCDKRCPLAQMDFIHGFPRCQAFWGQLPCEGGAE